MRGRPEPPGGSCRNSAWSALSTTSSHFPFRPLCNQLLTRAKTSKLGSLQPGMPTSLASFRMSSSNRAALLAWIHNTHVSGECFRSRLQYSIATCDFLLRCQSYARPGVLSDAYPTPPSPMSATLAPFVDSFSSICFSSDRSTKSEFGRKGTVEVGSGSVSARSVLTPCKCNDYFSNRNDQSRRDVRVEP